MANPGTVTTTNRSSALTALARLFARTFTRTNAYKAFGAYLLYLVIKYRNTAFGIRPRPDIDGPRGIPLLGNLVEFLKRPRTQNYQHQMRNHEIRFGSHYTVSLPGVGRIINITDPEMLDHVLRVNFWAYEKGSYLRNTLAPMVGQGIFGADGEHWRWQRKLTSHIFNVKSFRTYTSDVFCREAQLVIDYLSTAADTDKVVDLQNIFYLFTLDSFGEIAFGQSFGCLKDPEREVEFAAAFDRLNHALSYRIISPIWKLKDWWTGNGKVVEQDTKTVHEFAYDVIRKRRAALAEGKQQFKDLMQLFIDARDEHDQPLSDEMLKDELINMVLAGRDTTAQALSWMFYLMHRADASSEVMFQMTEEIDSILKGELPTYESTKQQKYAEACFYETLRLYPSVPQNMKVCVQDDVLPGGIRVYKGENIGWCSWAMGRLEVLWGRDAKEFKPERWLMGEKPTPGKYVSFHLGPRTCLGQQFATIEAITITSMLLQNFTFELVEPDKEPAYIPALTLPMATGLPVRVKRRVPSDGDF
ncbi:MAG: cytochrome P450 [Benniella sp.]|nr:MAG: cytochrome P450 [Benniella sp.]